MKKLLLFCFTLIFSGCAQMGNQNRISTSDVNFKGGIFHKSAWDEKLDMKRYSWFAGATLHYDLIIGELTPESKFNAWISKSEKSLLKSCTKVYVGLLYAYQLANLSTLAISSQLEEQGLSVITMPSFGKHLQGHYTFAERRLHQHKIVSFCQKSVISTGNNRYIDVPGFETLDLKL